MTVKSFLKLISSMIIPGNPSKGILSGSEVNFYQYLKDHNKFNLLTKYIENMTKTYEEEHQKKLLDCQEEEIENYIIKSRRKNFRVLNEISVLLCECYYTDASALTGLGLTCKPPFPEGNIVHEIDLTLLEGVYNRGTIYRKS